MDATKIQMRDLMIHNNATFNVSIKVTDLKSWNIRMKIACFLIRLAGRLIYSNVNITLDNG